jgi:hypothetical protein
VLELPDTVEASLLAVAPIIVAVVVMMDFPVSVLRSHLIRYGLAATPGAWRKSARSNAEATDTISGASEISRIATL